MTDLGRTIGSFVDCCLPRFTENKAMIVAVEIYFSVYTSHIEKRVKYFPKYVFYRPNNYTKVLTCLAEFPSTSIDNTEVWKLVADHDSEWTTCFKEIFNLRMKARNEVNLFAKENGIKLNKIDERTEVARASMLNIDSSNPNNFPDFENRQSHIVRLKDSEKYRFEKISS